MALLLLSSILETLPCKEKARVETFKSWLLKLMYFDKIKYEATMANRYEELKAIEKEKQIFLNEIGVNEILLRNNFLSTCFEFRDRFLDKTTVEEIMALIEEMKDRVYYGNETELVNYLVTAIDKYILEKEIIVTIV